MSTFLFCILIVFATITAFLAYNAGKRNGLSDSLSRKYVAVAINSSVWSICFGAILVQTDTEVAYILRCIGMVGTFNCLISATFLISEWSGINKTVRNIINAFSLLGIAILPFNIKREYIEFMPAKVGMSYSFKANIWTNLYLFYSVAIALCMFGMVIWMIKSGKKRRMRVVGRRLLLSLVVITLGMLFDTILPAFGIMAVPTSSMGQALCIFIVYTGINFKNKNAIDVRNIAQYINNSTEVYILAYDEELKLNLISRSALKFMNLEPEKVYKITDLFDLKEEDYFIKTDSARFDAICVRNNVTCNLGIEVLKDDFDDTIGYIVSVTDMTEKMAYISEIEEARRKADAANESKSAFLASMSHEIRTPLNAVMGMDEMIIRENDVEEIHVLAGKVMDAGKSLLAIIDDILDFSKIESGMMNIVEADYDFAQAVREMYSIVTFRAKKKGLRLIFEIDDRIPRILRGDELRIRQILMNIINNAIKYTKVGWVKVSMTCKWMDGNNIELIMAVEDTGIGIKKEDIPKLFEKFKRLDENINHKVEGTGLGLSIVYSLTRMMKGRVDVKSVYERGSKFTVVIPQKVIDRDNIGTIDLEYSKENRSYKEFFKAPEAMILAVDDNQVNLSIVKGLLKNTEVNVDTVANGFEALEKVKNKQYHIILLDHVMPEIDGIEVLRRMKSMDNNKSKDAAVIALTANALAGAKEEYISYGFDDYIPKPIDACVLEKTILNYLPKEVISSQM